MKCLLSDLKELKYKGTWRFDTEMTEHIRENIDYYFDIFRILDRQVAEEEGIDLEDTDLVMELALFKKHMGEDHVLSVNWESQLLDLVFGEYLQDRFDFYEAYFNKGMVRDKAIIMMCTIKRLQLQITIRVRQLLREVDEQKGIQDESN